MLIKHCIPLTNKNIIPEAFVTDACILKALRVNIDISFRCIQNVSDAYFLKVAEIFDGFTSS